MEKRVYVHIIQLPYVYVCNAYKISRKGKWHEKVLFVRRLTIFLFWAIEWLMEMMEVTVVVVDRMLAG